MDLKDIFSSFDIRTSHADFPVKSARTENRRVKDIHTVRSCDDNNAFIDTETVHFHKHLV